MEDLRVRMEVAAEAAWEAGRVTLAYFQARFEVERKADLTPVTIADREAERRLVEELSSRFPDDGILGEEHGERPGRSGYRWVVDPIDGTKSFIHGVPLYAVLVGLEDPTGEAVVGAACLPALGELIVAARGEGCWWNSRRARVSSVDRLSDACVLATGEECFELAGAEPVWKEISAQAGLVRGWGDAYGHLLVATGRAEAMVDPVLADWDCVALAPIVDEAGGVFTDWKGQRTVRG
ncbi:MAG TPA: inositol monophosphatase family protein, partial [Planctomycetota bacterium]|nr:inositol monophosphatase family protein [Planctomycetota bacterium]